MSNLVSCTDMATALEVVDQCLEEGFKAIASPNLNGPGWIVEYWTPRHNGHVIQWRKAQLRNAIKGAGNSLATMHECVV